MLYGIAAAGLALLLTTALCDFLRGLGPRAGRIFGGIALLAGALTAAAFGLWGGETGLGNGGQALLLGTGAVALVGLADDVRPLPAVARAVVVAAGAVAVVYGAGLGVLQSAAGVLWIALVSTVCHKGGPDGAAPAVVGAVTALGLAACAVGADRGGLALLLCTVAAALGGFLIAAGRADGPVPSRPADARAVVPPRGPVPRSRRKPSLQGEAEAASSNCPARRPHRTRRLLLGGCGRLATGFLLSSAAVLVQAGMPTWRGAAALLTVSAVLAADIVLVLLARHRAGRPLLRGGPDHFAHRLRRLGLTSQGVAVVLGLFALCGGVLGILVHREWLTPAAVLPLAGAAALSVVLLLRAPQPPPVRGSRARPRTRSRARVVPPRPSGTAHPVGG
ncbi:undecaprenyl/decaprenyl-phosphate alpha-N-acetylglucosaminyl 1-phosphate transferase [Streptomyces sp. GC420]|uniref:undecaprenyl/decaprenyl-phosphate alpha-N-acetylglucosaminyl 1-phosphate transferase n=1 Tax=Streptomyces sp. GC420 TaxID=2697568 RepID=UPI001414EB2F|nr:undecaprenyl/decaprenyl-phosphate alpha-N-acetylglucosaminyl 1-phosphate transferase [Streptomyces sp. GC420]NBM20469.1 undecaprenyl/decaprenyl-phosphate alpha-N-acetylglucosaminyl 1-phosphate transferase [Streptomyces sp. GC420]